MRIFSIKYISSATIKKKCRICIFSTFQERQKKKKKKKKKFFFGSGLFVLEQLMHCDIPQSAEISMQFRLSCRRHYNVRFVLDRVWKQIDTNEYLNRSTTTEFVSTPFRFVWLMQNPLTCHRFAFYRISLHIGCWLTETSSSKSLD